MQKLKMPLGRLPQASMLSEPLISVTIAPLQSEPAGLCLPLSET